MKKVIEQKDESRIEVEFHEHRIQLTLMSPFNDFGGEVVIGKSTAREVSLAICPELETEKINFAVGFAEWLSKNDYEPIHGNRFCKKFMSKSESAEDLIQLYLTPTTNGNK